MDTTKRAKRVGRGTSAFRIIQHRKVHELHKALREVEGPRRTKYLNPMYFAELIAEEIGYAPITVIRIMNRRPENPLS